MCNIYKTWMSAILTLGIIGSGWADQACLPIARECMKLGYVKGGYKEHKGLVMDCIIPILKNKKTIPNVTFSTTVRQQCQLEIAQKLNKSQ